jgi:hypothetical protein
MLVATLSGTSQEPSLVEIQNPGGSQTTTLMPSAVATVHGTVRNAATGEPLPRALVRIEGDAFAGTLTDGDGRFELPNIPLGPQAFQITRPGFRDDGSAPGAIYAMGRIESSLSEHNVIVAAEMPDLVFNLSPSNSIHGQIELSTGDPAQGIVVTLLRQSVQDGRAGWTMATNARTNSEGIYRFAGLADGVYAVHTEPAMDTDPAAVMVEAGHDQNIARSGFASVYYPDARDISGASRIQVSGGQEAQANIQLTLEPFHMVRASVTLPGAAPSSAAERANSNYVAILSDAQGHQLPYAAMYDQASHTIQAVLPDGGYSMLVTCMVPRLGIFSVNGGRTSFGSSGVDPLTGETEFSVAGHPVTSLRVALSAQRTSPIQVSVTRTKPISSNAQNDGIAVNLSQAGGAPNDGMIGSLAEASISGGALQTNFMNPGAYWVHTAISARGLCEQSFTAGGASLAREPLILGLSGATAPLTLTLRDDCASLKVSLPASASTPSAGEEGYFTVYIVPDFDTTNDVTPLTLRPSSGGSLTFDNLTPGNYHVYTFSAPVQLEYRNPDVLAALPTPGQVVSLSPNVTSELVLEVPAR